MKQRFLRGLGGLGGGEQVGEHVRNCGDDRQYDQGRRKSLSTQLMEQLEHRRVPEAVEYFGFRG
ncbi:hypothetical protein EEB12_21925 [Rhodococcus sp. WS1]|nr:hypothetical protein [Rhodococcus erythropolis]ROZ56354.1 hypothetical protein EEB12_21925 [Rhodococcus sp. WS1]